MEVSGNSSEWAELFPILSVLVCRICSWGQCCPFGGPRTSFFFFFSNELLLPEMHHNSVQLTRFCQKEYILGPIALMIYSILSVILGGVLNPVQVWSNYKLGFLQRISTTFSCTLTGGQMNRCDTMWGHSSWLVLPHTVGCQLIVYLMGGPQTGTHVELIN